MEAQLELDSNTQLNYTPFKHPTSHRLHGALKKVSLSLLIYFLYFGMTKLLQVFAFLPICILCK